MKRIPNDKDAASAIKGAGEKISGISERYGQGAITEEEAVGDICTALSINTRSGSDFSSGAGRRTKGAERRLYRY